MGLRLSNVLDDLFRHINNQLVEDLPANRFVTAFLGVLDSRRHHVRYHAAGQGPLLHYRAAGNECCWYGANTIPWGIMSDYDPGGSESIEMQGGDVLVLLTDGFYEAQNPAGEQLGRDRVGAIVARLHNAPAQAIVDALLEEVDAFTDGQPQADDLTALLVRRKPGDVHAG
jgi:phosphoserine phosphatase